MATIAGQKGGALAQEAALEFDQAHKHHVGPRYSGAKDAMGRPHGEGVMTWAGETCGKLAGQRYTGSFVDGLFEGEGTFDACDAFAMRDGRQYVGQWRRGRREGAGATEWDDGRYYHGGYLEDERHGPGLFRWGKKVRYDGEWARGKKHGGGSETFADGSKYEGQYVTGERHGNGQLTFADGTYYRGAFAHDQFHGAGRFFHRNGDEMERPPLQARAFAYEGRRDDRQQPHRSGDCTYQDGSVYSGQWRHGKREGAQTQSYRAARRSSPFAPSILSPPICEPTQPTQPTQPTNPCSQTCHLRPRTACVPGEPRHQYGAVLRGTVEKRLQARYGRLRGTRWHAL